jgi:hypothetical protein
MPFYHPKADSGWANLRRSQNHVRGLTAFPQKAYNPGSRHRRTRWDFLHFEQRICRPVREWSRPGGQAASGGSGMPRGQSTLEWVIGAAVILGTFTSQRNLHSNQGD